MRRYARLVAVLAAVVVPLAAQADMSPPASGPAPFVSPEGQASEAGAAAGFAAACGADPTPVRAAFANYLARRHGAAGERQRLWHHLSLAESAMITSFGRAATGCAGVHEVVVEAVRRLDEASR
jgi:hypothetical protein